MRINRAGGSTRILYGEGAPTEVIEIGYMYVDQSTGNIYGYSPTGNIIIGGPDFHVQNTDQLLDEGGANETTAAEIRALLDSGIDEDMLMCGVKFNKLTDTWTRTGRAAGIAAGSRLSSEIFPYLDKIKSKVIDVNLNTIYELDPANNYNKKGVSPSVMGTDDAGTASKLSATGVFTEAESAYKGRFVHNTTDDTYAMITAKDSDNVLSISKDIMALGETFEICTAVLNGDDGQVVVENPLIYFYFDYDANGFDLRLSELPLPGYSPSPAHYRNGRLLDFYYYGKYEGVLWDATTSGYITGDGTAQHNATEDKIGSVAGYKPVTSMTRSDFETMCKRVGSGWHSEDGAAYWLRLFLFWVTYAGGNSQSMISEGNTKFSSWDYANCIDDNGKSNSLGMTDGGQATVGGDKSDFCVMFGVENPWGNVWKWLSNLNIYNVEADSKSYAMMEPTNNPDFYVDNADCLDSYEKVAELPLTDNYIKMVGYFGLPVEVGGGASSTSYLSDYYYTYYNNLLAGYGTDWRVARVGGTAVDGVIAGVSCLHAYGVSAFASSAISGRLCAAKYKG